MTEAVGGSKRLRRCQNSSRSAKHNHNKASSSTMQPISQQQTQQQHHAAHLPTRTPTAARSPPVVPPPLPAVLRSELQGPPRTCAQLPAVRSGPPSAAAAATHQLPAASRTDAGLNGAYRQDGMGGFGAGVMCRVPPTCIHPHPLKHADAAIHASLWCQPPIDRGHKP
eukprot:355240-Chlamydomonas_euryale.AAC.3